MAVDIEALGKKIQEVGTPEQKQQFLDIMQSQKEKSNIASFGTKEGASTGQSIDSLIAKEQPGIKAKQAAAIKAKPKTRRNVVNIVKKFKSNKSKSNKSKLVDDKGISTITPGGQPLITQDDLIKNYKPADLSNKKYTSTKTVNDSSSPSGKVIINDIAMSPSPRNEKEIGLRDGGTYDNLYANKKFAKQLPKEDEGFGERLKRGF